jgi:hypothetical protein
MNQQLVNEKNDPVDGGSSPGRLPYQKPEFTEIEMVAFDVLSTTCEPTSSAMEHGSCFL